MTQPRILALFGGSSLLGQERGNIEALGSLRDRGCDVLCLIRDEDWSAAIAPALDARGLSWRKVPYIATGAPRNVASMLFRNFPIFIRANWIFLRAARAFKPTHVHAFNPLYVLNFLAGLLVTRTPMVYRSGDEPVVHNVFWRFVWRFVVWRSDRFVANSRFTGRSLVFHGVEPDRIALIYNRPMRRDADAVQTFPTLVTREEKVIAFVGQVTEDKGVQILIDAFRMLATDHPDSQLFIAGRISRWTGDAWARRLYEETIADPRLKGRVTFLGETDDVPALLAKSLVHVAPSLFQDPSPNVVVEAKLEGCASIVFPNGGMPELIEDGVDGFVCREPTAKVLAENLRRYLDDPELAWRHGHAARKSLARLGVARFEDDWLKVYGQTGHEAVSGPMLSSPA